MENKEINAVYVATPPSTHLKYALAALKANKAVYLEKPMALDSGEARQIQRAIEKNNGFLTVAHHRRKLPAFLKVKELLGQEAIGRVHIVDITILQPKDSDIIVKTEDKWRLQPEISGGGYFYDNQNDDGIIAYAQQCRTDFLGDILIGHDPGHGY